MTTWAIVPAAGIGQRMGSDIPKQYLPLANKPVLRHSLEKLLAVQAVQSVVVVLHAEDSHFKSLSLGGDRLRTAIGGAERQQSVLNGLDALRDQAEEDDWVLVHDAVRPCVLVSDIENLLGQLQSHEVGGLLAAPQDNTLKRMEASGHIEATVNRQNIWQAYTPQAFRFGILHQALTVAAESGVAVTDESSAVEALGLKPLLVEGDRNNVKITRAADLALAELILQAQNTA